MLLLYRKWRQVFIASGLLQWQFFVQITINLTLTHSRFIWNGFPESFTRGTFYSWRCYIFNTAQNILYCSVGISGMVEWLEKPTISQDSNRTPLGITLQIYLIDTRAVGNNKQSTTYHSPKSEAFRRLKTLAANNETMRVRCQLCLNHTTEKTFMQMTK